MSIEIQEVKEELVGSVSGPYVVNAPLYTFQTIEKNDDEKFILQHKLTRLCQENMSLYVKREEKDMVNQREEVGKGRTRPKQNSRLADVNLYNALISKGAWFPHGLTDDEMTKVTPHELTKDKMLELDDEQKMAAIKKMFECTFKVTTSAKTGDISFLFQKDALVEGLFIIGDKKNPFWVLPMKFKRPSSNARSDFRISLYSQDDLRKTDLALRETIQHPRVGVNFFMNHFESVENVGFLGEGEDSTISEYTAERKQDFLRFFNPIYMVEASADLVTSFDSDDED